MWRQFTNYTRRKSEAYKKYRQQHFTFISSSIGSRWYGTVCCHRGWRASHRRLVTGRFGWCILHRYRRVCMYWSPTRFIRFILFLPLRHLWLRRGENGGTPPSGRKPSSASEKNKKVTHTKRRLESIGQLVSRCVYSGLITMNEDNASILWTERVYYVIERSRLSSPINSVHDQSHTGTSVSLLTQQSFQRRGLETQYVMQSMGC